MDHRMATATDSSVAGGRGHLVNLGADCHLPGRAGASSAQGPSFSRIASLSFADQIRSQLTGQAFLLSRSRPERLSASCQPSVTTASSATSVGVRATRTPLLSSASAFACALPDVPETIAPAWAIVFPGGAVN